MSKPKTSTPILSFDVLVSVIGRAHAEFAAKASRAVNSSLTLRNWLVGFHIEEYERRGVDRQQYGEKLLDRLSESLLEKGVSRCDRRELYRYRQFYLTYPGLAEALPLKMVAQLGPSAWAIMDEKHIVESATPQSRLDSQTLLACLSFSHFVELIALEDDSRRAFYEAECVRGNWSVRELKRQIASLYYVRSGQSKDKVKLSALTQQGAERAEPTLAIRDPHVFEFLGLEPSEVMGESHLEDQLLDRLHDFLLELGQGFCFEARHKRILIGDTHHFVDLVFYHRILKCHVLVESKVAFSHQSFGQLNTYVSWYRQNMMMPGDNVPVGILLCTQKDHALVQYALACIDNELSVSKYLLELPKKEEMERFIEQQIGKAGIVATNIQHTPGPDSPSSDEGL